MNWLVAWFEVKAPWRARCEMTADAIASSRAMIDFHGLVLRLTRSTCAGRSICLPFCTLLLLSRLVRAPNAIRSGPAWPMTPENDKALGSGCSPAPMPDYGLADQGPAHREADLPGETVRNAGHRRVPGDERCDYADVAAEDDKPGRFHR